MSASFEEVAGFVLNYEQAGERHRRGYLFGPIDFLFVFREQKSLKTGCLPDFLDEVECQLKLSNSSNGLLFLWEILKSSPPIVSFVAIQILFCGI